MPYVYNNTLPELARDENKVDELAREYDKTLRIYRELTSFTPNGDKNIRYTSEQFQGMSREDLVR